MDTEMTSVSASHSSRTQRRWPRPRDLEVLRWASEQYAARVDHVEALIERSHPTVLSTFARLREAGLVSTRRFMVGEPMWALPTWKGLKTAHLPGQPWVPTVSRLEHLAAINAVRLHVERRTPEVQWVSERRLRTESRKSRAGYAKNLPDGMVVYEGRRVAFQVELCFRGSLPMERLFDELERTHDATLCFCTPDALRALREFAESGRWANLGIRELSGIGGPSAAAGEEER